jgi:hypothetical protein
MAKFSLQSFYVSEYMMYGPSIALGRPSTNSSIVLGDWVGPNEGHYMLDDNGIFISIDASTTNLYQEIYGWQFAGVDEQRIEVLPIWNPEALSVWSSEPTGLSPHENVESSSTTSEVSFVPYEATFSLDESIIPGPGVVPYNSTIWWDGRRIELEAPFLDVSVGGCSAWLGNSLGACLCRGNEPIMHNFLTQENMQCVGQDGYVWGISSFVCFVGLAMEIVWVIGCYAMYFSAYRQSRLVLGGRSGAGRIRNVLDLAEAIRGDLGEWTGAYQEKALKKALDRCPPVRFVVAESKDVECIRLTSLPAETGLRKRLQVDSDTLYG